MGSILSSPAPHFDSGEFGRLRCRSWYPQPLILGEIGGVPIVAAYRAGNDYHLIVPCPFCPPSRNGKRRFQIHRHGEPLPGETFQRLSHCHWEFAQQFHLAIVGNWPWKKPAGDIQ
ncbi:hypothetical protein SH668x_001022 [Planctomicrobium sp. SH668]|uniref:hypothetical protein n=1 Tax=Planctomicrobium sp. SH668 TaxID=3448126 RepID=UPI003F5AF29F